DRPDEVPAIVTELDRIRATPDGKLSIGVPVSILDAIPAEQPKKLVVLGEIRTLLDEGLPELEESERQHASKPRPPADLSAASQRDLRALVKSELTERDGRLGTLVLVRPADELDEYDGHDLLLLAHVMRTPALEHTTVSGAGLIFADIITSIR